MKNQMKRQIKNEISRNVNSKRSSEDKCQIRQSFPRRIMQFRFLSFVAIVFLIAVMGSACSGRKEVKLGEEAIQKKEWDKAVDYYLKLVGHAPDNIKYRLALSNALISASNEHMNKGERFRKEERLTLALAEFEKALEFNPENNEARIKKHLVLKRIRAIDKKRRAKTEIQKIKEIARHKKLAEPKLDFKRKPFSLKFINSDVTQIFKVMQKMSGVTFLYDQTFKSRKIALNFENVYFMDALRKIMAQLNCFYKVVDPTTVIVIPDTPAKRKYYEELVTKTFFLSNGDPENVLKIVRILTGIKSIVVNKDINAMSLKGTPAEVALAEKIIAVHDKPKGELYIDIEIIEINKSRTRAYGIELSQYSVTETYSPVGADATAGSSIRLNMLKHTDASDYLLSLPSINYKLLKYDSDSKIKARPQLRVVDQEEVKVRLGDKVPIPTTNFVPYNTGGPAQQPITSYQMQDIGININITPRIHHDGLISLKMEFELTFITVPGEGGIPPTIGNRSINTVIKLRDNETSMLAGLLRDTERKTIRGLPGLTQLPVLKEIFSSNNKEVDQTDIILTLTPRIIRFPDISEKDLDSVWSGTLLNPGLKEPTPDLEVQEDQQVTPKKAVPKPVKTKPQQAVPQPVKTKPQQAVPQPVKTKPEQAVPQPVKTKPQQDKDAKDGQKKEKKDVK